MKCLTVCQPWAWAIVQGPKRIENRSWPTGYRGPLLIHAGKSKSWLTPGGRQLNDDSLHPPESELVFGAVLGLVDLVNCIECRRAPDALRNDLFAEGPWLWVLANPRPLAAPYPLRGQLGLFDAPPELVALLEGPTAPDPASQPQPSPSTRTRVVNVRHAPAGSYLYVGRAMPRHQDPAIRQGSIWGNPFKVGPSAVILQQYRAYVLGSPNLTHYLHSLRGQTLGCWCCQWDGIQQPPPACHACILAELADSPLGDAPTTS